MSSEIYQLVAIDQAGRETVIELNNDNENNKGLLSFIDSGTTYMEDKQALVDYLMEKGKLENPNVEFAIKYTHNGLRYLPVIYNDPYLRYLSLNIEDENVVAEFVEILISKVDNLICKEGFFEYVKELNSEIYKQVSNGNYINAHYFDYLRKYYETYAVYREGASEKAERMKQLKNKIGGYKTIRTLYTFYNHFLNYKNNNINENKKYDIPEEVKYIVQIEKTEDREIQEELKKAYEQNGMDGVWSIADGDDILDKGYKFR